MRRLSTFATRLWKDERGASMIEYSILIGLIVAGVVATITGVGTWVGTRWTNLRTVLGTP